MDPIDLDMQTPFELKVTTTEGEQFTFEVKGLAADAQDRLMFEVKILNITGLRTRYNAKMGALKFARPKRRPNAKHITNEHFEQTVTTVDDKCLMRLENRHHGHLMSQVADATVTRGRRGR